MNHQSGFLKIILAIIIILIVLAILNIDLRQIVESEVFQSNLAVVIKFLTAIWDLIVTIWYNYIKEPAYYVWQNIINPLIEKVISREDL